MSQNIRWDGVVKKEATGIDDCDLGKVQQVEPEVIVTEKGIINIGEILSTKESR